MRWLAPALLPALVLVGCGQGTSPEEPAPAGQQPATAQQPDLGAEGEGPAADDLERPPPIRVKGAGDWIEIAPWSWCYRNGCADGMPPDPLPDLGTYDGPILVDLPAGWQLSPTWRTPHEPCGTQLSTGWLTAGDGPVTVPRAGGAGTWQLDLFARPAEGGDVTASVQVTTSTDAPVPAPELHLTSFFDHDGEIVQYGPVELAVRYLAHDLSVADLSGELEVVASDGQRSTIDLQLVPPDGEGCDTVGSAVLTESGEPRRVSEVRVGDRLGPPPYDLTVVLDLAGTTHRTTAPARWPDDVDDENSAILLQVEPPLPQADPGDFTPTSPAPDQPQPGQETPTG